MLASTTRPTRNRRRFRPVLDSLPDRITPGSGAVLSAPVPKLMCPIDLPGIAALDPINSIPCTPNPGLDNLPASEPPQTHDPISSIAVAP